MIYFLVCARFRYTLDEYLSGWAKHLASETEVIPYESLGTRRHWHQGTYIFTDIERLIRPEIRASRRIAERLAEHPDRYRVLNDPRRVLTRYRLLRKLHREGINAFNVHRVGTPVDGMRFPVFVKREYEHSGKGIELLRDADALRRALRRLGPIDRLRKHRLLITEYCDVADQVGRFRKLSAMRLGSALVPRHILLSDRWLTKKPDLITPELCDEEAAFIATGKAHDGVKQAFDLAGIDYGRIDYGMVDGNAQVWEINTNPRLVPPRERIDRRRLPAQADSARQINATLEQLAAPCEGEAITIDPKTLGLWRGPLLGSVYKLYTRRVRS